MRKLTKNEWQQRLDATDELLSVFREMIEKAPNIQAKAIFERVYKYTDQLNWDCVLHIEKK